MLRKHDLEGIALSTASSEREKVREHLLNTYYAITVYHFTYIISIYSPINLKKKNDLVVFDLRG